MNYKINYLFVTLLGIGKLPKIPGSYASFATTILLFVWFHVFKISDDIFLFIFFKGISCIFAIFLKIFNLILLTFGFSVI